MKRILIITFLLLSKLILFGQEDIKTGIIYRENHAFSLTATDGWVLDNKSGVGQGLYAVFYRQGESWEGAETVMYANTSSLEYSSQNTIGKLIKNDCDKLKSLYPDTEIIDGKDIVINPGVVAKIKYLSGKSYGNFEAMAYIDARKTGIMIILSSRSKKGFNNSLAAIESLVKSYFFIADNVIIEKENK